MRTIVFAIMALGVLIAPNAFHPASGDSREDAIKKELEKLEGTWVFVSIEANGKKLPEEDFKNKDGNATFVLKGGNASVRQKDQVLWEGTFKLDPTKKPKTVDLTMTKGKYQGESSLGIYELDGDKLKACYAMFGAKRERPTEFATAPNSELLQMVYMRQKK